MKRFFFFLTVAAVACCAACSDDPEVAEPGLSLLEDKITFDMFGGSRVLEITADSPWTITCDDTWCHTNVTEGSHTKKIVLTVDQSFLPGERTTEVHFYAAGEEKHTVAVTQEKFEPILVLAENGGSVTAYGADNELTVNLRASVAWKVEGTTGWCGVSQSEGTKSTVVKLLLTDSDDGVRPRSATLTFSSEMGGVEPQQVTVVQRSTGANTVLVRAGETRTFPARRTDGSYVKGAAVDWIWATEAGLVSDLAYDAAQNGITCTAAGNKQGSGLVALFDADGAVVWSWLVWVVDKTPSDVTVSGIAWQDRNVGAEYYTTDPKACVQDFRSYGLFYQWGRKEPFVGAKILSKNKYYEGHADYPAAFGAMTRDVVFNAARTAGWNVSAEEITAADANANPTTFYTRPAAAMADGWTEAAKGLNDPCPVGYRVPTSDEWQVLLAYVDSNAAKNQDSGDTYSRWYVLDSGGTFIGPSTMFRKGDNGCIHYPGRAAAYCTSTLSGSKPLPMFDWKTGDATAEGAYYERKMTTAYGMRCVKE